MDLSVDRGGCHRARRQLQVLGRVEGHHDFPQADLGNVEALVKHGSEGTEVARGFWRADLILGLDRCLIWFGIGGLRRLLASTGGFLTFWL